MTRSRWVLAAILAAFAALAAARLNAFCLLEPDSPGYLIQAKSLASFEGYRELDRPGRPLQTFRPPGLSLLLLPFAWLAPYSVVIAKCVVLATAVAALALTGALAARASPGWGAPLATALVASSPYALLHASEVVTEFPYLALSTAALFLATRPGGPPSRREVAALAALLSFLPLVRTIGIALVAALALWALADRARRGWLPAPAIAAGITVLWMIRSHFAGGPTYFGAIAASFERLGAAGFAGASLDEARFYASRARDVLLPGVWAGRPLYERLTVGGAPDLGGAHGAGLAALVAIVAVAAWGVRARWKTDGSAAAGYALFFVGILAVYPPRHERLLWPLVPLVWAFVPSGAAAIAARWAPRAKLRRALAIGAGSAALALLVWQAAGAAAIARDNLAWARSPDAYYRERIPPLYFADWRAAGAWLREHAAPGQRVLTRHSDVYFTSGRTQESVRFEELPPSVWRARIGTLGARWLVVPTSLYGKFFPLELLRSDPAYAYEIRWQGGDVAVVEVSPNRTGRVSVPAPPSNEAIAACDRAASREPERVDLATRCAELLAAAGRSDEAIARLRAIVARGGADVRIHVTLGQILLDARQDAEAAAEFRVAAGLPEADLLQQTIERGARTAAELAAAAGVDKTVRARTAIVRARARMDALRWGEAYTLVDEALAFAPYDPPVLVTAGDLAVRLSDTDAALRFYDQAANGGEPSARMKAAALRQALAAEAALDAAPPDALVAAAAYWAGDGAPGRALDLLERADRAHPGDPAIGARLADLRRFFGLD